MLDIRARDDSGQGRSLDSIAKIIVLVMIVCFLGSAIFTQLGGRLGKKDAAAPTAGTAAGNQGGGNSGNRAAASGTGSSPAAPAAGTTTGSASTARAGGGAPADTRAGGGSPAAPAAPAASATTGRATAATAGSGAPADARAGGATSTGARAGGGASAGSGASRGGAAAITVTAKTLKAETLRQRVALNGNVSSRTEVGIYPNTGGKITYLSKKVGDWVRNGEVIAWVDPSRPGTAYAMSPVTATVGGTIIDLPVNPGETVTTGTGIATIGSLNDLIVTIYVAEKYSAYLTTGLKAFVTLTTDPDRAYGATVTQVMPVVNSKNRTIEATLTMDEAVPGIRPGMFAEVSLVIREETDTLVVPKAAIKTYNDSQVVYVAETRGDGTVARRVPVTLGLTNDTEYQVLSGLSFGDRVITAGAVTDGSAVRIAGGE